MMAHEEGVRAHGHTGEGPTSVRDDRIFPATRWLAACIVPFLLAAFILLYFLPDHTDTLFAWTIRPTMTPLLMGAGYLAGGYFFVQVLRARRWHTVQLGFLPITAFTIFMAIATFMHLDRFHHGNITFYVWTALYIITPFLVPLAWYRNRVTDPGTPEPGDILLSSPVRALFGAVGVAQLAVALGLLVVPQVMSKISPWTLTPLTAQVVGGWFALPSVVAILMAVDPRWSAIRITLQSQVIGLGLTLVAVVRAWGDFDRSNPLTWAFLGAISIMFLGLLVLVATMEQRRGRQAMP
jgi:hypothetical protein